MKPEERLGRKKQKVSRKELAQLWFGQGCEPAHFQYVVVKCQTSPNNIKLDPLFYTQDQLKNNKLRELQEAYLEKKYRYYTNETTTLDQIRDKWYLQNESFLQIQDPQRYSMVWNNKIPLKYYHTIKQLKRLTGCEHLDESVGTISMYLEEEAPVRQDETAVDFKTLKEQYLTKLSVTIKVEHQKEYPFYHEIDCDKNMTISELKNEIRSWLNDHKNSFVYYPQQNEYSLSINQQNLPPQILQILNAEHESTIFYDEQKPKIFDIADDDLELGQYSVADVIMPGQIIPLKFHSPEKALFLYPKQETSISIPNPLIKVIYFQQQIPDAKSGQMRPPFQFTFNYLTLMNVKVSTILKEHNVKDSFFTSLYGQNKFIRPFQKFQVLKSVACRQDLKQITLFAVHQSIYFYKEINRYNSYEDDIEKMQNLWVDQMQQIKSLKLVLDDKLKRFLKIFEARKKQIEKLKIKSFCYPILLYSSPYISQQFNKFFRNSSLAVFQKDKFKENLQRYYPLARQLIRRLVRLPNYYGVTFRGTKYHGFDYKEGQVIEWNAFSSTSKDLKTARTFLKGYKNPYLFVIQSFTGKPICEYSFYEAEEEILMFPYTRFKVKSIDSVNLYLENDKRKQAFTINQNQKLRENKQVKLAKQVKVVRIKEIPVPKILSGILIVWIDPNIYENSKAFIEIIEKYKLIDIDLIQLESNQHLNDWLKQFSFMLQMPGLKVSFITNMNRSQERDEGIETLSRVRSLSLDLNVIFYVSSIEKTKKIFEEKKIVDPNVNISQNIHQLEEIILTFI